MSEMGIDQVLAQMRSLSSMAQSDALSPAHRVEQSGQFANLLMESVSKVNETQKTASSLAAAFEAEDPNVDLSEVMVAMQKSGLAFQALTTTRNKLVSAYQEIMSMPV